MTDTEMKSGDWTNTDGALTEDMQCAIHGDDADGQCWLCHCAGVYADPASCEPVEAEK